MSTTPANDSDQNASRALIAALGIDAAQQPVATRAALEALASEVLNLRVQRSDLIKELERAETLADRDPLCPIFNRRAFERELSREIALAARYGTPLSLIFIDLDRFKLINDRFGHATGDRVIKHIAQTLAENLRQTDIIGRLGGDEFGIALTHAEHSDCLAKARQLESLIDALVVRDANEPSIAPVQLGASCGTVEWSPAMNAASMIARADETMFRNKSARKAAR